MHNSSGKRLHHYILYKPYGVICQFTDDAGRPTLASLGKFPRDVYPVGRLDTDSEGLVLLCNDGQLKHSLLDPENRHPRRYLAQIERLPTPNVIDQLRTGVIIEGKITLPAKVRLLDEEPFIPPRSVPIRFRKNVPTSWIELVLHEGRNRQVRKMTAAVGHPTLRLLRTGIVHLTLDGLQPGEWRALTTLEIEDLRKMITPRSSKQS